MIAPLKLNLSPLIYKSKTNFSQGQIANITIKNKNALGVIIDEVQEPDFQCEEAYKKEEYFNTTQIQLANFISNYYCSNIGIAYGLFVPQSIENNKPKLVANLDNIHIQNTLTQKQNLALSFIKNHSKTLLFGDTGSGKTEIYIHMILEIIKQNKNVIFLMPEISLTPQMEKRLKDIFGDLVCIWHSKISKPKKQKILESIDNFRIIAGARSALFLPVKNLGLIIVDEEHDDAYKSNSAPRYNARDLSIYLSIKNNIKLILGSATPSIVSYYHFNKTNEVFRLKGRHFDSKKSIIFENSPTQITQNLIDKIAKTLEKNKQIIVFVPIRANFKTLICLNCGKSVKCKNCSISMSLHNKKNALICHYCGYARAIAKSCLYCNGNDFSALNIGTQEVAKELREHFKEARLEIFDRDEITTDSKLKKILNDFNNHKIDILVGTQMLSKGHDYHNVYLSVILGIDNLLNSNDFRAMEKSISLFYQIAGRCARKDDGEVFIQTLNKQFFQNFINDYEDFIKFELKNRVDFYPPYRKLALILSTNKNDKTALKNIESCKKIVESHRNIEIVGLNRAPIERINGVWRYFMLLRAKSPKELLDCVYSLKNKQISIDIDPLQLL
ncbi:primosomal protein N' [Helicobacter sp. 16-1353]|uniref:primosomal protein N' n=1 Tax=Helicobacter sp. 16-1353 TaxID=2004996 RepID=UPI00215C292E|nr:primosomal protein N' [Helicobacter sp. 16-1353]